MKGKVIKRQRRLHVFSFHTLSDLDLQEGTSALISTVFPSCTLGKKWIVIVWEKSKRAQWLSIQRKKEKPEDIHAKQILWISIKSITSAYLTTVMQGYTQTVLLVADIMMAFKSEASTQWELNKTGHAQLNIWNSKCLLLYFGLCLVTNKLKEWKREYWKVWLDSCVREKKNNLVHLCFCLSNTWLSLSCIYLFPAHSCYSTEIRKKKFSVFNNSSDKFWWKQR